MPLLSSYTNESFGINLSGTGTVSWTLAAISSLIAIPGQVVIERNTSAEGMVFAAGVTKLFTRTPTDDLNGSDTRELQFFSAINLGTASLSVTLGKLVPVSVSPTAALAFFQFSPPTTLQAGQTMTYVKGAGFTAYDSIGRPQTSASHS